MEEGRTLSLLSLPESIAGDQSGSAAPLDSIEIRNIRVSGKHGVSLAERQVDSLLEIDVRLSLDLSLSSLSDELADTVCYSALRKKIQDVVEKTSFKLLERLSVEILNVIFQDSRVDSAEIRISKPERLDGATPTVCLRRRNPRFSEGGTRSGSG